MRILHINKTNVVAGGVEEHIDSLARLQQAAGHEPSLLAVADPADRRHIAAPTVLVPHLVTAASARFGWGFAPQLRRLAAAADVLHFHFPNPAGELALLRSRLRTPSVVSYQNDVSPEKPLSAQYQAVVRRFLARVDRILVSSPNLAESSPVLREFMAKVRIVPLAVDVPTPLPPRRERTPGGAPLRLIFVGRLVQLKGVDTLLRLVAGTDCTLQVVGDGPERAALVGLAAALGVSDRVIFHGFTSEERKWELLRGADVLALPSRTRGEGFGLALLEGMAAGCALLSTELRTGTSWINQHDRTGVVVPVDDVEAMIAAVRAMSADASRLSDFQRASAARFHTFSMDAMFAKVMECYTEVLR